MKKQIRIKCQRCQRWFKETKTIEDQSGMLLCMKCFNRKLNSLSLASDTSGIGVNYDGGNRYGKNRRRLSSNQDRSQTRKSLRTYTG